MGLFSIFLLAAPAEVRRAAQLPAFAAAKTSFGNLALTMISVWLEG
jgi:hypothetical protein